MPLTKREYADALADASGKKAWLRAPGRTAYALGSKTTGLTRSLRVSNDKFRSTTGWAPDYPSAVQGWQATASVLLGER